MGILDAKPFVKIADAEAVDLMSKDEILELLRLRLGQPGQVATLTSSTSGTNATINWTAPTDIGGSAITGYYAGQVGGAEKALVDASTLTATFSGLTAGTSNQFYVDAVNANGRGTRRFITILQPQATITPAGTPFYGPFTFTQADASKAAATEFLAAFPNVFPTNGADYGVQSNRGYILGANSNWAGSGRYFTGGADSSWVDFEVQFDAQCVRATTGVGVSQSINFEMRHTEAVAAADGDPYSAYKLVISETSWRIIKRIANVETTLFVSPTFTENTMRHYVFRIKGSQISARAFDVGATDPAVWDYNAADTASDRRTNGVRPFIHYGNGNTTARPKMLIDNLVAAPV